jgi:prevent-host-death family protein
MESISISEARKNLASIVDSLSGQSGKPIGISVRGKEIAVVISRQEYEQLRRTQLEREFDSLFEDFAELNRELAKR